MSSYWQTLITAQVAGPNLTASTTATSILPTTAKFVLPAFFFMFIGQKIRISAQGQLGNIVTTPGTLTIDPRIGANVNTIFNGGAMQLSSTAHTTLPFWLDIEATCRAVGSGTNANMMGLGRMTAQSLSLTAVADSTTTLATLLMPNSTPTVGSGFDSTTTNATDLFATFSLSNANAIQVMQYEFIADNWPI
jgi:hypothetical protein